MTKSIRHSKYQVLGTPVFKENSAVDLSSGGVSFETAQEYAVGTLVLLEFEVNEETLKVLVCVAWIKKSEAGKFLVGCELIAIDPEHRKAMQGHLQKLLKSAPKKSKKTKKAKKKLAAKKKKKPAPKKKKSKKK
jgi:Tfp pilus assembly protein PilZ